MSRQTFELLILGSSSATPAFERNTSCQLLNIAERYLLIDCGEAAQIQLRKYKAKIQSIDHIFITHLHGDHFFGLPGLLSSMHLLGRKQDLFIYCPKELKAWIESMTEISDTRFNYGINWQFTGNQGFNLVMEDEKIEVFSFPLKHRIFCTGFLFREKALPRKIDKYILEKLEISIADIHLLKKGEDVLDKNGKRIKNSEATLSPLPSRSYAYCSDTAYEPKLIEYFSGVDVLYHESTFLEDHKERAKKTFHSTAVQAATIAKMAGVGQLILGHFSARYRNLEEFEKEAKPIFDNCLLAIDGKKIKI